MDRIARFSGLGACLLGQASDRRFSVGRCFSAGKLQTELLRATSAGFDETLSCASGQRQSLGQWARAHAARLAHAEQEGRQFSEYWDEFLEVLINGE